MMGVRQWIRRDGSIMEVDRRRAEKESAWDGSRRRWQSFEKTVGQYSKFVRLDPQLKTRSRGWQPEQSPERRVHWCLMTVVLECQLLPEIEIVAACAAGAVAP